MTVEDFPNFFNWIGPAALLLLGIGVAASLLGIFFGYVIASFRHGPIEAFYVVAQVVGQAIPDLWGTARAELSRSGGWPSKRLFDVESSWLPLGFLRSRCCSAAGS